MSDDVDRAQEFETFRRELGLRAARSGLDHLADPSGFGLCDDCGDAIEQARRKACPGARRCLSCQEAREYRLRNTR